MSTSVNMTEQRQHKTLAQRRWRRGKVEEYCRYCKLSFMQETPWQLYCCDSHRVLAGRERKAARLRKAQARLKP